MAEQTETQVHLKPRSELVTTVYTACDPWFGAGGEESEQGAFVVKFSVKAEFEQSFNKTVCKT